MGGEAHDQPPEGPPVDRELRDQHALQPGARGDALVLGPLGVLGVVTLPVRREQIGRAHV